MNSSVYFFGNLGKGYTQYPDDYTQPIFQNFYARASAPTQVATHREGDLMYYGYLRKLSGGQYIGFCVLLNGVMLSNLNRLFAIFEDAFASMVVMGKMLDFDAQGNIISKVEKLTESPQELARTSGFIDDYIQMIEADCQRLPPVSYNVAKDAFKTFRHIDNKAVMAESAVKYAYTYIFKFDDYDTSSLMRARHDFLRKIRQFTPPPLPTKEKKTSLGWLIPLFSLLSLIFLLAALSSGSKHKVTDRADRTDASEDVAAQVPENYVPVEDSILLPEDVAVAEDTATVFSEKPPAADSMQVEEFPTIEMQSHYEGIIGEENEIEVELNKIAGREFGT